MKTTAMLAAALALATYAAEAQEVTLKAVTSFAEKTQFSKNFERFIDKVNADGKGQVQINYIGGPRAMPPFEVGNAVRTKVVDIANVTGAFYTNLMPEADGFKLVSKPQSEQRKDGTFAFINELHNQKLNSFYLARQFHNVPFHIYMNKKIDKLDFTGLKIRVTPVYKDIVEALGGTTVTTAPGEVYTALERGVVDGYGWPVTGIFDLGWEKVTKFRMEPAFYSVEVNVLVNLDTWKSLIRRAAEGAERRGAMARRPRQRERGADQIRARQAGQDRHPADRVQRRGQQGVSCQGQRRRLGIGDQARAGQWRQASAVVGELDRNGAAYSLHPPLEGEGRERSERGGVNLHAMKFSPHPGSHLATLDASPSLPLQGRVRRFVASNATP